MQESKVEQISVKKGFNIEPSSLSPFQYCQAYEQFISRPTIKFVSPASNMLRDIQQKRDQVDIFIQRIYLQQIREQKRGIIQTRQAIINILDENRSVPQFILQNKIDIQYISDDALLKYANDLFPGYIQSQEKKRQIFMKEYKRELQEIADSQAQENERIKQELFMKHRREKLLQRQQNAIQKNVKNEKQQQKTENSFKNSIMSGSATSPISQQNVIFEENQEEEPQDILSQNDTITSGNTEQNKIKKNFIQSPVSNSQKLKDNQVTKFFKEQAPIDIVYKNTINDFDRENDQTILKKIRNIQGLRDDFEEFKQDLMQKKLLPKNYSLEQAIIEGKISNDVMRILNKKQILQIQQQKQKLDVEQKMKICTYSDMKQVIQKDKNNSQFETDQTILNNQKPINIYKKYFSINKAKNDKKADLQVKQHFDKNSQNFFIKNQLNNSSDNFFKSNEKMTIIRNKQQSELKNEFSQSSHEKQKLMISDNSVNSQILESRESLFINKKNLKIAYKIKAIPSTGTLNKKNKFVQSIQRNQQRKSLNEIIRNKLKKNMEELHEKLKEQKKSQQKKIKKDKKFDILENKEEAPDEEVILKQEINKNIKQATSMDIEYLNKMKMYRNKVQMINQNSKKYFQIAEKHANIRSRSNSFGSIKLVELIGILKENPDQLINNQVKKQMNSKRTLSANKEQISIKEMFTFDNKQISKKVSDQQILNDYRSIVNKQKSDKTQIYIIKDCSLNTTQLNSLSPSNAQTSQINLHKQQSLQQKNQSKISNQIFTQQFDLKKQSNTDLNIKEIETPYQRNIQDHIQQPQLFQFQKNKSPISRQIVPPHINEPLNEEDQILKNDNMMMLQQLERNILFHKVFNHHAYQSNQTQQLYDGDQLESGSRNYFQSNIFEQQTKPFITPRQVPKTCINEKGMEQRYFLKTFRHRQKQFQILKSQNLFKNNEAVKSKQDFSMINSKSRSIQNDELTIQNEKTKIQEKTCSTFYVSSKNDIKSNFGPKFTFKKFSVSGECFNKTINDRYEENMQKERLKSGKLLDFKQFSQNLETSLLKQEKNRLKINSQRNQASQQQNQMQKTQNLKTIDSQKNFLNLNQDQQGISIPMHSTLNSQRPYTQIQNSDTRSFQNTIVASNRDNQNAIMIYQNYPTIFNQRNKFSKHLEKKLEVDDFKQMQLKGMDDRSLRSKKLIERSNSIISKAKAQFFNKTIEYL